MSTNLPNDAKTVWNIIFLSPPCWKWCQGGIYECLAVKQKSELMMARFCWMGWRFGTASVAISQALGQFKRNFLKGKFRNQICPIPPVNLKFDIVPGKLPHYWVSKNLPNDAKTVWNIIFLSPPCWKWYQGDIYECLAVKQKSELMMARFCWMGWRFGTASVAISQALGQFKGNFLKGKFRNQIDQFHPST